MQRSASSSMRTRMLVLMILFLTLGFSVLIGRLFYTQIIMGEFYQTKAAQQQTRSITLGAKRGTIYDRNGKTLALSADVWNVCISPAELEDKTLDSAAGGLSEILQVDKQEFLDLASDKTKFYKRIKKRVDRDLAEKVLDYIAVNNIKGIFLEPDTKRFYTNGNLASTVLGFTNSDNHGAYGLESYYDKVLSGTPGIVVSAKNALGADMPVKYQQLFDAKDGNNIVLTIDEAIQHFLERNLETAVVEHSIGNRATGIVMNVKTGEILAMATKPDFNPNEPNVITSTKSLEILEKTAEEFGEKSKEYDKVLLNQQYDQWRNKAISDTYEPGSVFKIVTAATAVDNKLVSLDDQFFCSGSVKVSDRTIRCWKHVGHGQQDFIKGMQNSCNPVFIEIGQRIGARLFYDYMEDFGLDELTGIDLPGETKGILHTFEELNKPGQVEISTNAFGQTFKVTPLQMITAVSAAINGGYLMEPYIVKQVVDAKGNVIETTQPTVRRQVISEESSAVMRILTEAVVNGGSGKHAAVPGYRIGGKTGTSEKLDLLPLNLNVLSFAGFAPMDDPQYAILVMLDEPKLDEQFGSVIAAPVVGAVFQEMLPYLGMQPYFTPEELAAKEIKVPDFTGKAPHDAQAELTLLGLKTRKLGNGPTVIRQIPQAWQTITNGKTVILYTDEEAIELEVTVPNVVGMTAQEANTEIVTNNGLNIELRGVTTDGVVTMVEQQWPLAGSIAQTGDVIIVTLIKKPESEVAGE